VKVKIKKDDVLKALRKVVDPEIGHNIVDIGLVNDIEIKDGDVKIKMVLTSPLCPMGNFIFNSVEQEVKKIKGVKKVEVEYDWEHPWTPEKMKPELKKKLGI
jgi:metal-sulfur cluster biosynthetic enzyme